MKQTFSFFVFILLCLPFIACKKYDEISTITTKKKIIHQEHERSYLVHIPKSYNPNKKYRLIFVLHGMTSQAKAIGTFSGFNEQSDLKDFIVCYPQGFKRTWGIDIPVGAAPRNDIDDIGFLIV